MNVFLHLLLLPIFLILSALFSGSESAIFSLTEYERQKLKERNILAWKRVKQLLDAPTRTISLIISGNIIANTVTTSILGALLYFTFPEITLFLSILIVTSTILLLGEIFPKLLALRFGDRFSIFAGYFLTFSSKLIGPPARLLTKIAKGILSFFREIEVEPLDVRSALSELYALVKAGEEKGVLEKGERMLAEKFLDFGRRWVKEIMTPRVNVVAYDYDFTYQQVIETIKATKHTKYPVYKKKLDQIVGVLYSRDLLFKEYSRWQELIHPLLVIPESLRIDELLVQFREREEEIALVVDEYGGTAGIVTLEDIVEELVGEIEDEYQKEKKKFEIIPPSTYIVAGDISLNEISEILGRDIRVEGITTLAGLLLNLFQKVPSSGQSIEYKGLKFFIDEVSRNKIKKVTIRKTD